MFNKIFGWILVVFGFMWMLICVGSVMDLLGILIVVFGIRVVLWEDI